MSSPQFTLEHGEFLVRTARKAVEEYLSKGVKIEVPPETPEILKKKYGVFVTIETLIEGGRKELRGCIGYPLPIKPLIEATIDVAIAAAVEDPRFPPMKYEELEKVVFEVSILTPPQEIKFKNPKELLNQIVIGQDGLIVERGFAKGLLLPQVPVEYGWDVLTFLSEACMKAGLQPDAWAIEGTKIYKFQAVIFAEETPKGRVVKRDLMEELKGKE